jgi:hypothetical protein
MQWQNNSPFDVAASCDIVGLGFMWAVLVQVG